MVQFILAVLWATILLGSFDSALAQQSQPLSFPDQRKRKLQHLRETQMEF